MPDFQLQRIGWIMEPERGNPHELEGVLNPAAARGPDSRPYLFPRLVAAGNYSRLSPVGPRVVLAISDDLFIWKRLGLAPFAPFEGIDFVNENNKDACILPVTVPNDAGKLQMPMLHRPLFPGTCPEEPGGKSSCGVMDRDHESIWSSYCPMTGDGLQPEPPALFNSHVRLAAPVAPWEALKIGGGTPPMLTKHGWRRAWPPFLRRGSELAEVIRDLELCCQVESPDNGESECNRCLPAF